MYLEGLTVFVTGGTGSFGTAYIKHLLKNYNPKQVVVYSRDELKQFEQETELNDRRLKYVIGDIRNLKRLSEAMSGVDVVIHAAAMKQVVASERNPTECIATNVGGSENVIEAALANNVKKVLALSTDKAVNPINLYGATKLCADKLIVNANARSQTTSFAVVRYGNVVGSRGSVVPFFKKLAPTGRIPITDPEMTRFWITLDQAVRFVCDCLELMRGAEVFIAKIPSMRIVDLATAIAPACKQDIIGIRPGEKLHEIMVPNEEARRTLEFPKFFVITPDDGVEVDPENCLYSGRKGVQVTKSFRYASDSNPEWIDVAGLEKILQSSN